MSILRQFRPRRTTRGALVAAMFLASSLVAPPLAMAQEPSTPQEANRVTDSWAEAWKIYNEQVEKRTYEAASETVSGILTEARAANDAATATRALVELVQVRLALHGPERAVTLLAEEPWPDHPLADHILPLMRAEALDQYLGRYAWEIRRRDEMADPGSDLSKWTARQLRSEVQAIYAGLWAERESWGTKGLGPLGPYIFQNNYPPRIRSTLRDTITYLWLGQLEDRSWWKPEHDQEIFRLDLDELLAEAEPAADGSDPAEDVHPLIRIHRLLTDLEAWHRDGDRPEAAFEARSRWIEILARSFTRVDENARLRADLQRGLDALGSQYPWWSMGMAELAELWNRLDVDEVPDARIHAREAARAGARRHPESFGGKTSRHIAESIEAPRYTFQAMAIDGPERRSIRLTHKNLERIWLRAYPVDVEARLRLGRSPMPYRAEEVRNARRRDPVATWQVDLPATGDYRSHHTDVVPPLGPGAYMVTASARGDFATEDNSLVSIGIQIGDPVPFYRPRDDGGFDITVRSGRHGHALDGAEIAVYAGSQAGEAVDHLITDATGRVSWSPPQVTPSPRARHGQWQLLIRHDGEQVVHDRWARHQLPQTPEEHDLVLLYTDRSVYRPQQEVLWKAVVYRRHLDEQGNVERYAARVGAEVAMRLADANGQTVVEETVTTGEFGSASGRFTVPAGRVLGSWILHANDDGRAWIRVEEYKRPTFEVAFRDPTTALRLNRDAELVGEARYYFGLPVTEGRVRWRVERTPVWPYWWFWNRPQVTLRTIATGESELDAEGQFRVGFLAEADERLAADDGGVNPWRDVSYRYEISADVTSEGGETRSAERTIHLGFVAVDARIDAATGFTRAGEAARLTIRRTRLDGRPAAGAGQWTVHRLDQPEATPLPADLPPGLRPAWAAPEPVDPHETEGDRRSERWQSSYDAARLLATWPNGEAVASGEVVHAEDGVAELAIDLDAGAYRVVYRTEDPFGAVIERADELLVVGEAPVRLPAVLELERSSVEVGETARVLVHSGLNDQSALLEILHAGEVIDRRPMIFSSGDVATPQIVELPITRAHRGGLGVRLIVVRDHQVLNPTARLDVPWSDRALDVTFDTFRDHLRPGQDETWSVTVRRADGEPVGAEAAEVLAYMFDRGLDLFSPHDPPSIDGLYPSGHWIRQIETPFRMAQQLDRSDDWPEIAQPPRLRDDQLNVFSPWSIGGPGLRHRPMTMRMAKTAAGNTALMAEETMEVVDEAAVLDVRQTSAAMTFTPAADASPPPPPPPAPSPPPPASGAEPTVRTDFAETAFWFPDLRTDADGAVRFEFRVPDSVTEWHVWVHALTRDLRGGRLHRNARTSKELLVRPQMPRFLREGDRAELRVVVDNTGATALDGSLSLDLSDPATGDDLAPAFGLDPAALDDVAFTVGPRESTTLRFSLVAPRRPGPASLTVRGQAGEWSDGERRPLPVLPGRLHLTRSRSAMLRGDETADGRRATRVLDFGVDDPKAEDPSLEHDAFVVTVDGQLFTSVLRALPYLIDYPYECTEQTLNRYLASGLMTRLFDDHPSVGKLAERLAESRDGRFEAWNPTDPNRRLLLEETPWLRRARGGGYWSHDRALIKILDPEIARQHRDATWRKLEAAQAADGSFSWWPGGPESTYKTLYVLEGLSRALEAGLDVPKPMVERAWAYIHRVAMANDPELRRLAHNFRNKTYIAWILSNYPDLSWTGGVFSEDDRRVLLDQISAGWSSLEPRIKLYATMALHRGGRVDEARMVLDSVLDSAITDPDLGTYWQPERLSWVWYRDTIETHAFALRTLVEVAPDDARVHGLAQWLLLNKKLSHWKSTRATSEAIYALTAYLEAIDGFDRRQTVRVAVAGDTQRLVFEPDETETRRRILFEGDDAVSPVFTEGEGRVEIASKSPGFVIATATWHFGTDQLPEVSDGDLFAVERAFFLRVPTDTGHRLEPLADGTPIAVGDEVEVQLTLTTRHAAEYVHLRDPRGAGFEPMVLTSGHDWSDGLWFYREVRDSGTNFFVERLPAGEVVLRHRLRASMAGTFRVGPATVQGMYAPEFAAHSSGVELTVGD